MMEIICITVFSIELLVAIFMQLSKSRLPKVSNNGAIKAISFIIPFHNEFNRISPLIESINSSQFTGKCEFIFVDDHSTDETTKLIKEQLTVPHKIINNGFKKGKKRAIHAAVLESNNEFIITWDADVHFDSKYIQNLFALPSADLIILPVEMYASSLIGKLASIEFSFIKTFNLGFGAYDKPIACNGANLGFNKTVFLELSEARRDYATPSGDDMFLFWAMQDKSKSIHIYKSKSLAVSTPAPSDFIELMRQRQRWKGKMKNKAKFETVVPVFLQASVVFASVFTILLGLEEPFFFWLFLIKFSAELIASWTFIRQHISHFFILIIHQVWYPVYALLLMGIPFRKEKRWQ